MTTARNLLFGALAFQIEYIDLSQFAAVCHLCVLLIARLRGHVR